MMENTKQNIEGLRGELFHMILFGMAWALIGEYSLHFRDYSLGAIVLLLIVMRLAFYSIKLYDLEDSLGSPAQNEPAAAADKIVDKRTRFFSLIFIVEGVAIMATWIVLLNLNHTDWLIFAFAGIAGLHFLPLARVVRHNSYYILGAWICILSVSGYLLLETGQLRDDAANTLVAYGCAAGAAINGLGVMQRSKKLNRR